MQNPNIPFTNQQLNNWKAYEDVRSEGLYNMFAPQVSRAAGLKKDEFLFCMENYMALKVAYEASEDAHILKLAEGHGH